MYAWTLTDQMEYDSAGRTETTGPQGEKVIVYRDPRTAISDYQSLHNKLEKGETGWLTEDDDGKPIIVVMDERTIWPVMWGHLLKRWKELSSELVGRW